MLDAPLEDASMLLLLLFVTGIARTTGAYDEVRETDDGQVLLIRTVEWPRRDGSPMLITVHWLLQDDGSLRYDFDRQPPATREVHRRWCAASNSLPGTRAVLTGEGATHAFNCNRDG